MPSDLTSNHSRRARSAPTGSVWCPSSNIGHSPRRAGSQQTFYVALTVRPVYVLTQLPVFDPRHDVPLLRHESEDHRVVYPPATSEVQRWAHTCAELIDDGEQVIRGQHQ